MARRRLIPLPGKQKPAATPRQAAPPTTIKSKGLGQTAALPPPTLDQELGSSQPTVIREIVPALATPFQRLQTYAAMSNDAGVDVSMRAAKTPVVGADFFVEPYDDQPVSQEIAEFIWTNLAEGMSSPFLNSLQDILRMYEDGYSVLEKVYENRSWTPKGKNRNTKQYTMLKKLLVLPASTIKEITYDDNGGPNGIVQNAIRADRSVEETPIDIAKIIIFTFGRVGGDLTGKSLLRTAYPHWYYKTHFYKIDAIQKERHSLGVPKGKLLPGYTPNDKLILRNLLKNLRSNEEAFMVLTPNVDVEFAEVHGQLVNVLESADHHNAMILMNVMAQFLTLGIHGQSGGRATGGTQSDIFMKALRYVANHIADQINMYLIPELVVWNYPTNNFPKIKVRNIGETRDLQMLGSAIAGILAQGGITMDLATENWLRGVFDMPAKVVGAQLAVAPSATSTTTPTTTPTSNGIGSSDNVPTPTGAPQKGNVKPGGGGNTGKPPNAPQ